MTMTSYLIVERTVAGSCAIYQVRTKDAEAFVRSLDRYAPLKHLLGESTVTLIALPHAMQGGVGFDLVRRHWRMVQGENRASAEMTLLQIDDLIAWVRRVVAAVDPDFAAQQDRP